MSKLDNKNNNNIVDPREIKEWIQSLEGIIQSYGNNGAKEVLQSLEQRAKELRVLYEPLPYSLYRNTIAVEEQGSYPGKFEYRRKNYCNFEMERISDGNESQRKVRGSWWTYCKLC